MWHRPFGRPFGYYAYRSVPKHLIPAIVACFVGMFFVFIGVFLIILGTSFQREQSFKKESNLHFNHPFGNSLKNNNKDEENENNKGLYSDKHFFKYK